MLLSIAQKKQLGRPINPLILNDQWFNNRFARTTIGQHGVCQAGGSPKTEMRVKTVPKYSSGFSLDTGRDWTTPYQEVTVKFDAKMQDPALVVGGTATGHTIKVNTVAQTTTYRSGSGFNEWVFRIPTLVHRNDTISWSYDASVGATVTVMDGTELATISDQEVENYLTKYIRFNLCKATDAPVVSETVKIAIFTYAGGVASASTWASKQQAGTTTTDASGLVFLTYTGTNLTGDTVYVAVIRPDSSPTESMIWVTTVQ